MSIRSARLRALLAGRRVLITGAARGIGAALARRLHERGAKVALLGLEPESLKKVAAACGDAPYRYCDVAVRQQVEASVQELVRELGGLDIVVANAGIGAQMAMVGGDVEVMRRTLEVNVMGVFHTLRAAGEHIGHPRGYALVVASAAVLAHPPLMGAYSASKAAVESLGSTFRAETKHLGTKVGIGYFAELDTDMTRIGFGTQAASKIKMAGVFTRVTSLDRAIDRFEAGIARRQRQVVAPAWVGMLLPFRMAVQRVSELRPQPHMAEALLLARNERAPLTTPQPKEPSAGT
ncbi:SDR family NAD(P)-dependent oxidoreductase [Pendulispora albinea]|uniref:SDR family NAD(P)-dependent oxidoreductase n=1 Tax=Pendulispora albinea TaxID=2741071 RepID=A0ABZ2LZL1_9BACT